MYIRHPYRKLFVLICVVAGSATVFYAGYKVEQRDEQKRKAAFVSQHKAQSLVETASRLKKAVDAYQTKAIQDGIPLPPGKTISIRDLIVGGVLSEKDLKELGHIDAFAYTLLPYDAPDKALQLVVVTDQGRATINKRGEGSLYGK